MGRKKGSKNFNGKEPWKEYGLTRDAYYNRLRKGIPLEQAPRKGRKRKDENVEYEMLVAEFGNPKKKVRGRFSGLDYDNPPEKLEAIKEKYRNGVSVDDIAEMVGKLIL